MVDKYSKPNAYLSTIVDISSFGIIQNLTTREAELAKFSSVGVTKGHLEKLQDRLIAIEFKVY